MSETSSPDARKGIFHDPIARIRVVTLLVLLTLWQIIAVSGLLYEGVVPQPLAVAVALFQQVQDPSLYYDLSYTMIESISGFFIGSALAVVIGVWFGANSFFRRAFEPYVFALAGTPKIIFLPILFLIFGLGIESKIAKAAMSAFFPVVFASLSGYLMISAVHLKVAKSFDLNVWQRSWMIYLPAMLPSLVVGLRLGMAMSIIGVLSAEIAYSNVGLGHRLIRYADQFQISNMYATIIVIFALSVAINSTLSIIEKRQLKYRQNSPPEGVF
ncbi:ABC-type nitrate/sulfonate/bicarbonate transport system permease component [Amorphus suaedae]